MKMPPTEEPAHWRQRADEARRTAEQSDDAVVAKTMVDIAAAYERLVAIIEARRASERQM